VPFNGPLTGRVGGASPCFIECCATDKISEKCGRIRTTDKLREKTDNLHATGHRQLSGANELVGGSALRRQVACGGKRVICVNDLQ